MSLVDLEFIKAQNPVSSGNTKMHFPDTEVFILLGAINSGWKYYAAAAPKKV